MTEEEFKGFVNTDVINFMEQHHLDKIQCQDEDGNKAKIARKSDDTLKVETTVSEIM
ncbi:hypothetical protein [Clostridium tyrobutyricum]|mgnify:FL=1|jgi:hypothetical protein|uniref:hypothetical protein n=1 Tax=Clostridium tyrobutyricum TaxID=1519 RepID=UPI0024309AD4|nr:hypothetical protein [Clostridium tyrobutyricum]